MPDGAFPQKRASYVCLSLHVIDIRFSFQKSMNVNSDDSASDVEITWQEKANKTSMVSESLSVHLFAY